MSAKAHTWTPVRLHEIALMIAIDETRASISAWADIKDSEANEIVSGHRALLSALRKELLDLKRRQFPLPENTRDALIAALEKALETEWKAGTPERSWHKMAREALAKAKA